MATSLEVLSLARARVAQPAAFATLAVQLLTPITVLPQLRALECHDIEPTLLALLSMPALQTFFFIHPVLISTFTMSYVLDRMSNSLRNLSITTSETCHSSTDYEAVEPNFVLELLRCFALERFQLRGRYFFETKHWRLLSRRIFPYMRVVNVWQPAALHNEVALPSHLYVNDAQADEIPGLARLDQSCLYTSPGTTESWHYTSESGLGGRERSYYRFFKIADPECDLSIATGELPGMWRQTKFANDLRKDQPLYSGTRLFLDDPERRRRAVSPLHGEHEDHGDDAEVVEIGDESDEEMEDN